MTCHRLAVRLGAVALFVATLPAVAAEGDAAYSAERARIAVERNAIEARFTARDRECRQRFVVSSCVAEARRDRRTALDALQVRQRVIDDARRRQRASDRRAELAAKAAEDAQRDRERAARAASAPGAAAAAPAAPASSADAASAAQGGRPLEARHAAKPARTRAPTLARETPHRGGAPKPGAGQATAADRRTLEAKSEAAFAARQKAAAEHRQETLDTAARRTAKHPPAKPLPVPSAAKAASGL